MRHRRAAGEAAARHAAMLVRGALVRFGADGSPRQRRRRARRPAVHALPLIRSCLSQLSPYSRLDISRRAVGCWHVQDAQPPPRSRPRRARPHAQRAPRRRTRPPQPDQGRALERPRPAVPGAPPAVRAVRESSSRRTTMRSPSARSRSAVSPSAPRARSRSPRALPEYPGDTTRDLDHVKLLAERFEAYLVGVRESRADRREARRYRHGGSADRCDQRVREELVVPARDARLADPE